MHKRSDRQLNMRVLWSAIALFAGCAPVLTDVTQTGQFVWEDSHHSFGGMSGIAVLDQGRRYVVINDRGVVRTGDILREDGQIVGMTVDIRHRVRRLNGDRVSRYNNDAEGVAALETGPVFFSFEGLSRVAGFDDLDAPPVRSHASAGAASCSEQSSHCACEDVAGGGAPVGLWSTQRRAPARKSVMGCRRW